MKTEIRKHLSLLGKKVEDRVTGQKGIVDTVSFDLYGCVQATLNTGLNEKGEQRDCRWFDVSRLRTLVETPVMPAPNFDFGHVAEGRQGAAHKPTKYQ